jgi:formylglycine-generating enzyme required for sulfatase activity
MNARPGALAWHWPSLGASRCGAMTDRERLGLPDHYIVHELHAEVERACKVLRREPVEALLETLASLETTLSARIASGNLLALAGDPRIVVERPAMVDVAGGIADIGLDACEVASVLDRFGELGLERAWIEKECPRHRVELLAYRIARFPVTNLEYRAFAIDTDHSELPSSWHFRRFPEERANHPAYSVSAASADAYARWLARRTGRGFRLPSEAEWEHAAAGPNGCEFPWGAHFDPALANTAETGLFSTSAVGAFAGGESAYGLCDMAGNVEEYVADEYTAYPGGVPVADHLCRASGGYRVARGGSFARFRDLARTRRRHGHNPVSATYAMGFRLAESP